MWQTETVAISSPSTSDRSTVSRSTRGITEVMFYHWKYRHYFKLVDEGDKNLWTICTFVHLIPNHSPVPETERPILRNTWIQFTNS